MSHLSDKSETNIKASKLLIDNEMFASSVHCSYYAMLQFMICEFKENLNKTFAEIVLETKNGEGTHNYIVKGIINYIKSTYRDIDVVQKNVKDTNVQNLNRTIKDIKTYRVKSDYHNFPIDKEISEKYYQKSKKVIKDTKEFLS